MDKDVDFSLILLDVTYDLPIETDDRLGLRGPKVIVTKIIDDFWFFNFMLCCRWALKKKPCSWSYLVLHMICQKKQTTVWDYEDLRYYLRKLSIIVDPSIFCFVTGEYWRFSLHQSCLRRHRSKVGATSLSIVFFVSLVCKSEMFWC